MRRELGLRSALIFVAVGAGLFLGVGAALPVWNGLPYTTIGCAKFRFFSGSYGWPPRTVTLREAVAEVGDYSRDCPDFAGDYARDLASANFPVALTFLAFGAVAGAACYVSVSLWRADGPREAGQTITCWGTASARSSRPPS